MSKLERWLTLIANLSVVAGIVFLAAEMRQNTEMMRAQIRDSITEKQMEYLGWRATSPELAAVIAEVNDVGLAALTDPEYQQLMGHVVGQFREWENSHYQYERGLFTPAEFEARSTLWRLVLSRTRGAPAYIQVWETFRLTFSPSFRAEIDRIVAEAEQAQ